MMWNKLAIRTKRTALLDTTNRSIADVQLIADRHYL